ncbi:hypothetical protein [Paenibacillus arenilitoris]|uniref:Uncharacterized protein n=1 Tax=Paenibacillus arenilitoris TaxID=2772299 RepID=A0A927CQN2_9BACL|nr:hypothetical protein [Paenibacillus arenilitoris]MBD2872384.1 hypothetical protein [Paenibacillus arenilitoris]
MNLRFLSFVSIISLFIIVGCSNRSSEILQTTNFQLDQSNINLVEVKLKSVIMEEDARTYTGVEYGIVATLNNIPKESIDQIGFSILFKGETKEIYGQSGTGAVKGYSIIEEEHSSLKIFVPIIQFASHLNLSDQEYLTSTIGKEEIQVQVYFKDEPMFFLEISE